MNVQTDYVDASALNNLKTYSWKNSEAKEQDALIRERVRESADKALRERGYALVENGAADFLLDYQFQEPPYERRADVHTGVGLGLGSNGFSSIGVGFGSGHRVRSEKLALKVLSPIDQNVIWQGEVVNQLRGNEAGETTELIDKAVKAIVEEMPTKI